MSDQTSSAAGGGLVRKILVTMLENRWIRFVLVLSMSFAYDIYSQGKTCQDTKLQRSYILEIYESKII